MKKGVIGLFVLVCLIGMVSSLNIEISTLNNQPVKDYYSEKVDEFSWINDSDMVSCWYSLDNGVTNKTMECYDLIREGSEIEVSKEGWNNWTIYANDSSGNENSSKVNFWVDSIEPDLRYFTPISKINYTNKNTLNFQFWLNDTNKGFYWGIPGDFFYYKITNKYDESTSNTLSENGTTYYSEKGHYDLMGGWLYEGNYTWIAKAKDKYPNGTTIREVNLTGTIIRDTEAPTISIDTPKNNANLSGNFTIKISANGGLSGMKNITIQLSNTSDSSGVYPCPDNETCNWEIPSKQIQDGNYNITANATDKAGNMNSTRISITIDNTAPIININAPLNTTYNAADGHRTILNYTLIEANPEMCWLVGNGTTIYKNARTNFTNLLSLESTQTTWKVYCNDSAGNQNSTEVSFYVDTIAPNLTAETSLSASVFSPENGDGILDELIISMNASELIWNWSTSYIYNSSNDPVARKNGDLNFYDYNRSITWDGKYNAGYGVGFVPDGNYTINTTITDKVGNTNTLYVGQVRVDNTAPKINFEIPTPATENYNSVQTINVSASDDRLSEIKLYVDNIEVNSSSGENVLYSLGEGNHTINATAYDEVGNKNVTETRNIFIDMNAPQISYTAPTKGDGDNVSQNWIFVNVSILEGNEDRINFSLYNDSGLVDLTSRTYTQGSESINWTGLADGVYYYNVSLNDIVGNSNKTLTWKITLDTSIPQIENVSSSRTHNSITLNWDTNESADSYVYYDTTYPVTNTSDNTGSDSLTKNHSVSLTGLSASTTYYCAVVSSDSAGNANWSEINVTTKPVPVKSSGGGGGGGRSSCSTVWQCSAWTPCNIEGVQTRECEKQKKYCSVGMKPSENRTCEYQSSPKQEIRIDPEKVQINMTGESLSEFLVSVKNAEGNALVRTEWYLDGEKVQEDSKHGSLDSVYNLEISERKGKYLIESKIFIGNEEEANKTWNVNVMNGEDGFVATITGGFIGFAKSKTGKTILVVLGSLGLLFLGAEFYRRYDLSKKSKNKKSKKK